MKANTEIKNTELEILELEQAHLFDKERDEYLYSDIPSEDQIIRYPVTTLHGCNSRDGTSETRALSELGNAERLQDKLRNDIYYIYHAKAWLHWVNGAWVWCHDGARIRSHAASLYRQIYNEGHTMPAESLLFASWSRTSQKEKTIVASVSLLKDMEHLRLPLSLVDISLFHVGINNAKAVIDLKTGLSGSAKRQDYMTKSLSVNYLGNAGNAIKWKVFVEQIFEGDKELIDWVKRWCGYLLTGSTQEHLFVFCYGSGANGKSVFAETLTYILGDYARVITPETLTDSKRSAGGSSSDIADLIGARLALCSETENDKALAESLVKSLVSGDSMTARKLYGNPIQFKPQFKLMMLGNHKPIIKGNDYGIWRRIRLIPFLRTFKDHDCDLGLLDKLKDEAPDILAWMIEGCLDWQEKGLSDTPVAIKKATGDYHEDQDLIGQWISERCSVYTRIQTSSADLYADYKEWCFSNGLPALSNIAFGRTLGERGFIRKKANGNSVWQDIVLKKNDIDMPF